MTARQRLLVDCDPGIDDAFALFCALRFGDLVRVTTVAGNVPIEHTTRNARYLLELAGADIPVHRGASEPLRVSPSFAKYVHGAAGLGTLTPPEPSLPLDPMPAAEAILEHCKHGDALIIATGPLTNLAQAILLDDTLPERIAHIHWMGGSATDGNVTEFAEFNSFVDPEAVKITLESGAPLTMYGLDLTHQVRFFAADADSLRQSSTLTATAAAEFLLFYEQNGVQDGKGQPMHDPCAVLGATHPDLFQTSKANIVVDVSGDEKRGMTAVSEPGASTNHHHAVTADAPRVRELILAAASNPGALDA